MAETDVISLGESDLQLHQTENQSNINLSRDLRHDSLHKVLHKTAHPPRTRKAQGWPRHLTSRTSPQSLFFVGFRDCASEVIRFLTEDEKVEKSNPLLVGLQSHLTAVSKAICQETIMDLDRTDADPEMPVSNSWSQVDSSDTDRSRCAVSPEISSISPIISRSAYASASDSSVTESELSMSISSVSDISHNCAINDNIVSSPHDTSTELPYDNLDGPGQTDDVFNSPSPYLENHQVQHIANQTIMFPLAHIPPLSYLALAAVRRTNMNQVQPSCSKEASIPAAGSRSPCGITTLALPVHYISPLDHSSPLPRTSPPQWSPQEALNLLQQSHDTPMINRTTVPEFSSGEAQMSPDQLTATLPNGALWHFHCQRQSTQQHQQNLPISASSTSDFQTFPSPRNALGPLGSSSEISEQLSSILEIKANFLPGIDTTSVASGNFADILLSIEACRFNEDPRVKALAEELIHLIQDDGANDDEDQLDSDDEDEQNNSTRDMDNESGIEMLDESAVWGQAVDMIEQ